MSRHEHTDECSGDRCGFRLLYESSQASLADMSARQGQALARVGRLRSGVVTSLRRNFPALSTKAEQQMGSRLSDVDDEILLAYLDAFTGHTLREPSSGVSQETLVELVEALNSVGVTVTGTDPSDWSRQIRLQAMRTGAQVTLADALLGGATVETGNSEPNTGQGELPATTEIARTNSTTPRPLDSSSQADPAENQTSLPVLLTERHDQHNAGRSAVEPEDDSETSASQALLGSLFSDVAVDLWDGPLGQVQEPDGRWSPSPVRALDQEDKGPAASAAVPPANSRRKSRNKSRNKPVQPASSTAKDSVNAAKEPVDPGNDTSSLVGVSDSDWGYSEPEPTPSETQTRDVRVSGSSNASAGTGETTALPEPELTEELDLDSLPAPRLHETPLRPQIQATAGGSGRGGRKGRTLRTQAQAPEELTLYPPMEAEPSSTEPTENLSDELTTALVAAASIPRPVFTRDLVDIAGSSALVEQWESVCRADPAVYPVRFIAPKVRHRPRGSLVFSDVHPASAADAWWQRCITTYRGAKLYEMAVLLHRVGDEIVSSRFTENAALLRLSTGKGLVGVIVTFETGMDDGSDARQALATFMDELLSERLVLIAALTTHGESGAVDGLVATLGDLALERSWSPSAPVVAARSWEYADNRGTTAVLALGG